MAGPTLTTSQDLLQRYYYDGDGFGRTRNLQYEALAPIATRLRLRGQPWTVIEALNDHFGAVG